MFVPNKSIDLRFSLRTNKKTGERQWQCQIAGLLYVPHWACEPPKFDGQLCACLTRFKIAESVIVVSIEARSESNNQRKRNNRQSASC